MRKRALLLAATALAGGSLALVATGAFASGTAQQIHGHLVSQQLTAGCTSPVGLCTAGRLEGVINGDFVFTATSLQPSSTPGVFFYTGHIVVTTNQGEVTCEDAGAYSFADPSGPVVDLCTITSGTDQWAGVHGHLRIHGTFTLAEGGNSHYEGEITH